MRICKMILINYPFKSDLSFAITAENLIRTLINLEGLKTALYNLYKVLKKIIMMKIIQNHLLPATSL